MAIIQVREVHLNRSHIARSTGERQFTRHFQVLTDNPRTSQLQVRLATGIPRLFDIYNTGVESDNWCFVESVKVDQEPNDLKFWYITIFYNSVSIDPQRTRPLNQTPGSSGQPSTPPTSEPDQFAWSSETFKKAVTEDINGDQMENTVGDPFYPPHLIDDFRLILTVTRNQATFNGPSILTDKGTVNSFAWNGFPPLYVLLYDIDAQTKFQDNVRYWQVKYVFKIGTTPWNPTLILNRGFNKVNDIGPLHPSQPIISKTTAQPTRIPHNLDEFGGVIPKGGPKYHLERVFYYEIDFTAFNITIPMS